MDFLELVQNLDLKLSQSINPKNKLDEATQNHNKAYIKSNQLQASQIFTYLVVITLCNFVTLIKLHL